LKAIVEIINLNLIPKESVVSFVDKNFRYLQGVNVTSDTSLSR
jgi:hypothetical protein